MGIGKVFYWHSESNTCYTADTLVHGQRTPIEAFCQRNPKLLGLGRQFGQIHFGAFGVFWADLSAHINQSLLKTKPLYPNPIWDWDLNLGCKELGI